MCISESRTAAKISIQLEKFTPWEINALRNIAGENCDQMYKKSFPGFHTSNLQTFMLYNYIVEGIVKALGLHLTNLQLDVCGSPLWQMWSQFSLDLPCRWTGATTDPNVFYYQDIVGFNQLFNHVGKLTIVDGESSRYS